jgi:hypothetical protein
MKVLEHVTAIGRVGRKRNKKSARILVAAYPKRAVIVTEISNRMGFAFETAWFEMWSVHHLDIW